MMGKIYETIQKKKHLYHLPIHYAISQKRKTLARNQVQNELSLVGIYSRLHSLPGGGGGGGTSI